MFKLFNQIIMDSNKNNINDFFEVIGVVSLAILAFHLIKSISNKTETSVISDEGLKAVQDPKKAKELRKVIDDYHEKGTWNKKN